MRKSNQPTNSRWNGSKKRRRPFRSRRIRKRKSRKLIPLIGRRSPKKRFFLKIRFAKHKTPGSSTKWNRWKNSKRPKSAACRKTARQRKKNCALALPINERAAVSRKPNAFGVEVDCPYL